MACLSFIEQTGQPQKQVGGGKLWVGPLGRKRVMYASARIYCLSIPKMAAAIDKKGTKHVADILLLPSGVGGGGGRYLYSM
jgi:hypothetical protein